MAAWISPDMPLLETITALFRGRPTDSARGKRGNSRADLRSTRRVPQRMRSGYVWTEKLIAPRACMVRDLSTGGARVEILGEPIKTSLLLDGVKLYFETEKHELPCTVAWVKGSQLGLKFEGRPRPPSRKYK